MTRPSFTRRTNGIGQRIRAEHINELQVAIEGTPELVEEILSEQPSVVAAAESAASAAVATEITATGVVRGEGIARIIASYDENYPLDDGDLLIILDAPTFFTDFSADTTGVHPAEWSEPWVDGAWTVEADAGATGGKVLRVVNPSTGRYLLSWDTAVNDADANEDVEIVFKWRVSSTSASVRAIVRGSGAGGTETGYSIGYQSTGTSALVGRYVDGSATTLTSATVTTISTSTWYISRVRINGTTMSYRTWDASTTEPGTWDLTWTEGTLTAAGLVGLMPFGAGTIEYDWVGVAFYGGTAPTEAA